jgi:hypothetical protein
MSCRRELCRFCGRYVRWYRRRLRGRFHANSQDLRVGRRFNGSWSVGLGRLFLRRCFLGGHFFGRSLFLGWRFFGRGLFLSWRLLRCSLLDWLWLLGLFVACQTVALSASGNHVGVCLSK